MATLTNIRLILGMETSESITLIIVLLCLLGFIIYACRMRTLAMEGKIVLYTGWLDIFTSVFVPIIFLIIGGVTINEAGINQVGFISLIFFILSPAFFLFYNIRQAMRLNPRHGSISAAVFRIVFSLVWILAILAAINLLSPNTTRDGRTVSKGLIVWMIGIAIAGAMFRFFGGYITDVEAIPDM